MLVSRWHAYRIATTVLCFTAGSLFAAVESTESTKVEISPSKLQIELDEARARLEQLKAAIESGEPLPEAEERIQNDAALRQMRVHIAEVAERARQASVKYGENAPKMKELRSFQTTLEKVAAEYEQTLRDEYPAQPLRILQRRVA